MNYINVNDYIPEGKRVARVSSNHDETEQRNERRG